MTCTVAVAGKGGTGKTTLSALLTTALLKLGKTPILAVDADPNANLHEALGVTYGATVVGTAEAVLQDHGNQPAGLSRERVIEYGLHDALVESRGFDLLVMGHGESAGCYCHANDLLRGFLEKLTQGYAYVVIDNEAGMEHLSRRTARHMDVLLLAANPTVTALRTVRRIHDLIGKLKLEVGRRFLVLNQLSPAQVVGGNGSGRSHGTGVGEELAALEKEGLPVVAEMPFDERVYEHSVTSTGILNLPDDSRALVAAKALVRELGI